MSPAVHRRLKLCHPKAEVVSSNLAGCATLSCVIKHLGRYAPALAPIIAVSEAPRRISTAFPPPRPSPPKQPHARARDNPRSRHSPPPDRPARTPSPWCRGPDREAQRGFRVPSGPDAGPGAGGFPHRGAPWDPSPRGDPDRP